MCPGVVSCETNIVLACLCGHCLAAKPTQGTTDVSTRHCLGQHTAFDLSEEGGIFSTENYYIYRKYIYRKCTLLQNIVVVSKFWVLGR